MKSAHARAQITALAQPEVLERVSGSIAGTMGEVSCLPFWFVVSAFYFSVSPASACPRLSLHEFTNSHAVGDVMSSQGSPSSAWAFFQTSLNAGVTCLQVTKREQRLWGDVLGRLHRLAQVATEVRTAILMMMGCCSIAILPACVGMQET